MKENHLTGLPSVDKPWLKYYSQETIDGCLPECTFYDYLLRNNEGHFNDIALNYYGRKITYGELLENIEKTASGLYSLGVRCGDIVTIFSINTPETLYCIYALNLLGATANMEYVTESEKAARLAVERSESKVVIVLDVLIERFFSIAESDAVDHVISLPLSASMPTIVKVLYNLKAKRYHCNKETPFGKVINQKKEYEKASYRKNRPAVIVHSGGTTGIPKGVVLTDDNLNYISWVFKNHKNDTQRGDTWMCAIPVFHAFGLAMGVVWPLAQGMQLVMVTKYNDRELVRLFIKHRPNHIMASGAHIPSLQNSKVIAKMDLSFFKTCGFGGTPLSREKEKELVEFLGARNSIAKASVGYGMSETCSAIATELNRYYGKPGSSGIILCKSNIKVMDVDTAKELGYGEVGELCFNSPGLMLGYFKNESETNNAFFYDDKGCRWLHSGDLGYIDEDGFIFITGRIKRIYSTRAEKNGTLYKLFPDYMADVISRLPEVRDCAVVCVDDSEYKTVAIAFVVKNGECSDSEIEKSILNHIGKELPSYYTPKKIIFKSAIPMTPIGKIDYQMLEKEGQKLRSEE